MRSSACITVLALVFAVTGLSVTGVFAPVTDSVQTGDNYIETGALAAAANVQLSASLDCSGATDNLASAPFDLVTPGGELSESGVYLCLRNAGSSPVSLSVQVTALSDIDVDCTGDEAAVDLTCGLGQAGELGDLVSNFLRLVTCDSSSPVGDPVGTAALTALDDAPSSFGYAVPVGTDVCVAINLQYHPSGPEAQAAQSDQVTWRYTFQASV
jgi:hypothetical protein